MNKYRILKILGEGCGSIVYLVEHCVLHQQRVIKCFDKADPHCASFLKEIKFLKNLKSRNIPTLYDYEEDRQHCYLVEEYIEGESFKDIFANSCISGDNIQSIIYDFIELAEIFAFLHAQMPYPVLYLDLKPEHVVRGNKCICLLDFGAAMEKKDDNIEGCCMGTLGFASPELVSGRRIDERTDIYSLGALFFWCLTKQTVREGIDRHEICELLAEYPVELRSIIAKCLEENIEYRFSSVREFVDKLKSSVKICDKDKASFVVAVVGSQQRVGVTHFCVALVNYLNMSHRKCLYEEKTDSSFLNTMYENAKGFSESQGIIYTKNFCGLPKYGQAVVMDKLDYETIVKDYGVVADEISTEIKRADVCIVIGGVKGWEIGYTRKIYSLIKANELIDKTIFVLQGDRRKGSFFNRGYAQKNFFLMPYCFNPFNINSDIKRFFDKLLENKLLMTKRGGNRIDKHKIK